MLDTVIYAVDNFVAVILVHVYSFMLKKIERERERERNLIFVHALCERTFSVSVGFFLISCIFETNSLLLYFASFRS